MDLRAQTSLLAAVLCYAIAVSVLLRPRKRKVHQLFALFCATIASWYASRFVLGFFGGGGTLERLNLICAVVVPVTAVFFFQAFAAEDTPRAAQLKRAASLSGVLVGVVVLSPWYRHPIVATLIFVYLCVLLAASLYLLDARGRAAPSRFERARLRFLALIGALAATFTIADYLQYVGLDIPPVGTVLTLVFLYVLSQSIVRYRVIDLYELAGRLGVLTVFSFLLAAILWVLVYLAGERFFLHTVVAGMVLLLLIDPLRAKVEEKISQLFFRDRYQLEQSIGSVRKRIAHVMEVDDLVKIVLAALERSRRATHASLFLVDDEMDGYVLEGHIGPEPVKRIAAAPARPLLDRLLRDDALVIEALERDLSEQRESKSERDAETTYEIIQMMEAMHASVCVAMRGEHQVYGWLCVKDDRLRDAYSPEDVLFLRALAAQAAIAIENSRVYRRMKERDRLAALGEMAAGLAHEIRNPLGAIKASAQYLTEPVASSEEDIGGHREFLDIIVEEVDRLNDVVSSFLDYARPSRGNPAPTDVNAAVTRTMQVLAIERENVAIDLRLSLAEELPPVRIDVEQLRQVIINLVQNAVQAMEARGELVVETMLRERTEAGGAARSFVEIRVSDTGPGIPQKILKNLFVPFVTTKDRGTGLGLAISQRIVAAASGQIEARTNADRGATFVVRLPVAEDSATGSTGVAQGQAAREA